MKDGFIKVAACTNDVVVADTKINTENICADIEEAYNNGAKIILFPELCITGYTLSDLFMQQILLDMALSSLYEIVEFTKGKKALITVGLPMEVDSKLYNVAAFINNGELLGIVPKLYIPNYNEFYEARHFTDGNCEVRYIDILGKKVPFGTNILFKSNVMDRLIVAGEICEDVWVPTPPSVEHCLAGATVIVNLSASDELTTKDRYRTTLISNLSARLICGYIYADAGEGESTTDVVYGAHNIICENGSVLKQSERFKNEIIYSEIDVDKLSDQRRRMNTYSASYKAQKHETVYFDLDVESCELSRTFPLHPFVPQDTSERDLRCKEILTIQALGLKKRLKATGCKCVVIGLSGGLDSTLALLVSVKAFDMLDLDRKGIMGITMPGFGTTDRTYNNAIDLARILGITLKEISIVAAVNQHFIDIEQDSSVHDVTYENSQARERTQILMDIANKNNGMVVGTGDMSELALGWATYNGDHMSMYAVNCSVPKTLVRHLVSYYADNSSDETSKVLRDVLDTPVSPELLPPDMEGKISQKTEDIVGPYELHDFYLYYMLRFGFPPAKIYRIAIKTFNGIYDKETIKKWLCTFYRRFFSQQFKRSCIPDGPKVGTVALSPRGDLRMPSDASYYVWKQQLDSL